MPQMSDKYEIDVAEFAKALQSGQPLHGDNGFLTPLIKQVTEAALNAELEQHLAAEEQPNRKNGYNRKTIKSSSGKFDLDVPRDRNGSFEPQAVKKHQTTLTEEMEQKVLSLFALGGSYQDVQQHISDMYGYSISNGTINAITDKLVPELKAWQARELEPIYPIVWLDAIHYKVKENGRYVSKAVYTLLGLNIQGKKELLGLYLSDSEGANYWLNVLTELQNRGVKDILIACVDGLKGFPEAIASVYPDAEVQLCIIHQARSSQKYVASKHQKEFAADLKEIYRAATKSSGEQALDALEQKWGERYPIVIKSWRNNWEHLSTFYKYPENIRKVIYTTNAVEAVHRQFRKLTKTKGGFSSENGLLKLLYAGMLKFTQKWTHPVKNWNLALSQFCIRFGERIEQYVDLK